MAWSNKVLREVIFLKIYERYGPNGESRIRLPAKTLEDLRREFYCEKQAESAKASGSAGNGTTIRGNLASNNDAKKQGKGK